MAALVVVVPVVVVPVLVRPVVVVPVVARVGGFVGAHGESRPEST
jgi:hypothetical protein